MTESVEQPKLTLNDFLEEIGKPDFPIVKIEETESFEIPDIDMKKLNKLGFKVDTVEGFLNWLKEFIQCNVIIDNFKDHQSRRRWESKISLEYDQETIDYLNNNRLRNAKQTAFLMSLKSLFEDTISEKLKQHIKEVINAREKMEIYQDNLPLKEKIAFIEKIKKLGLKILGLLKDPEKFLGEDA